MENRKEEGRFTNGEVNRFLYKIHNRKMSAGVDYSVGLYDEDNREL